MKRCPQCAAVYPDDLVNCPSDNTLLIYQDDAFADTLPPTTLPGKRIEPADAKLTGKIVVLVSLSLAFLGLVVIPIFLIFFISFMGQPGTNVGSNIPTNVNSPPRTPRPGDPTPRPRTVDEIRDDLLRGSIAFNKPSNMFLEQSKEVQLRLSPTLPVEALKKLITAEGEVQTREIAVSDEMEAMLNGDNFTIINPTQRKLVSENGATEWNWDVTPTKPGKQKLRLTLSAIVTYKDNEKPLEIKTFHEIIEVNVTTTQRFYAFVNVVSSHLQWIVPSLLIPVGLWMWNRRRKVAKGEELKQQNETEVPPVEPQKKAARKKPFGGSKEKKDREGNAA